MLLVAGAYGKATIDSVYINIADVEGLAAESRDAVASGFAAKASIHPRQRDVIPAYYAPDSGVADRARRIVEAARDAASVFSFEGEMVDEPLLRHARSILARESAAKPGV